MSEVPTLPGVFRSLSATNTNCGGTISFSGLTAIVRFLSSTKVEMSMMLSSKEVSFKSAIVLALFLAVPPPVKGCDVEIRGCPSPIAKLVSNALFNTLAPLTSLVCCILLAKALV